TACWSPFGNGLPGSPVVALSSSPVTTSPNVLVAGTFGRGVWQIPLATSGTQLTTGSISPATLDFGTQGFGTTSGAQPVTLTNIDFGQAQVGSKSSAQAVTAENSGGTAVGLTSVTVSGPFALASNSCGSTSLAANTDCQLQLQFAPAAPGPATGVLTMVDDAGSQTVELTGKGAAPPTDWLAAKSQRFGGHIRGQSSS